MQRKVLIQFSQWTVIIRIYTVSHVGVSSHLTGSPYLATGIRLPTQWMCDSKKKSMAIVNLHFTSFSELKKIHNTGRCITRKYKESCEICLKCFEGKKRLADLQSWSSFKKCICNQRLPQSNQTWQPRFSSPIIGRNEWEKWFLLCHKQNWIRCLPLLNYPNVCTPQFGQAFCTEHVNYLKEKQPDITTDLHGFLKHYGVQHGNSGNACTVANFRLFNQLIIIISILSSEIYFYIPFFLKYRRLHLPVNAPVQNMFSRNVKRLSFRCRTLKLSRQNVKCSA